MSHARKGGSRRMAAIGTLPAVALTVGMLSTVGVGTAQAATSRALADTHPSWATARADRGAIPAATQITTQVYLAGRDPSGLASYARAVSQPGNSLYHHYLTAKQALAEFGPTSSQVSSVEQWLTGDGLKISAVTPHAITATGDAAATNKAFGTTLHDYAVNGGTYHAPASNAQVPTNVASAVLGVSGLSNLPNPRRSDASPSPNNTLPEAQAARQASGEHVPAARTSSSATPPYLGSLPCSSYYGQKTPQGQPELYGRENPWAVCGYVPSQFRGAYGLANSPYTGRGVTVAIVDAYGSPTMPGDANEYAKNYGEKPFAKSQYTQVVTPSKWYDESQCEGPSAWAGEESIDIEAVHTMAPDAKVLYYGANSCNDPDFLAVYGDIVDKHLADMVSNSWGGVMYSTTGNEPQSTINEYEQLYEQGAVEGIGFYYSAGDCGDENPSTSCGANDTSTQAQTDFPDSDPWVTAVGGTAVNINQHNGYGWETGWGSDGRVLQGTQWTDQGYMGGGGGGTTSWPTFTQPFYQKAAVPTSLSETLLNGSKASQPMRVVPDVAMNADPITGMLVGQTQALPNGKTGYAESPWGGTSLACPLFVGVQADAEQAQRGQAIGFADPAIYARYGSLTYHDVSNYPLGKATTFADVFNSSTSSGQPVVAMWVLAQTGQLQATSGYDDVTGVGSPNRYYVLSYRR